MYLVSYDTGEWETWRSIPVFVTSSKKKANDYINKFNSITGKYRDFYSDFEEEFFGSSRLKDKYIEYFDRWLWLHDMGSCYYEKIEKR